MALTSPDNPSPIGKSASQHAISKLGAYLAEAMQIGGERYSLKTMDMGNTQVVIDVRLQLAQGKRLDEPQVQYRGNEAGRRICAPVLTNHASRDFGFYQNKPRRLCGYIYPSISPLVLQYSTNEKVPPLEASHQNTIWLV